MSIKVTITKDNEVVQTATFPNEATKDAWLAMLEQTAAWGNPARWLAADQCTSEQIASALDERTVEVMGSEVTELLLPSEYSVSVEDVTAEVEQERVNQEALAYLASTDWLIVRQAETGAPCPEEVLAERARARASVVKGGS